MIDKDRLTRLQEIYSDADPQSEAGIDYVYLPKLRLPDGSETPALLCPMKHGGYPTRLFLGTRPNKALNNWTQHVILGQTWHSWSWNYINGDRELIDILLSHMDALK